MLELSRTVRLCINDAPRDTAPQERYNTFSAWPAMRGLGRYYQVHVRCVGEADPVTGYFMNIKEIDTAVREKAMPCLERAVQNGGGAVGGLMREMIAELQPVLQHTVREVRLDLTPYYHLAMTSNDMNHVIMRQQFEFAAAHRLHVDQLSDDENRRVFGKCNNPSGHGHNYRLEVAVSVPIDPKGSVMNVETLDRLVDEHVVEKLDHKHLNVDVPQFKALNPSVENIAKVIWDMLKGAVAAQPCELAEVSVWETGKTVCTYRGK